MSATHVESGQSTETAVTGRQTLWRNADFLTFWSGETLSLLGSQVTSLALPLTAVLVFHATSTQVGLLRFLQLVPYLGLAMVFGAWVDRARRKRVMLLANGARMVLVGLVPLLSATHLLTLPLLLALACAIGVFSVLFDVSWMSFVPTLVRDPARYPEANQKLGTTSSAADVAGPGLAGALIGALSAPIALAADAASYLVSLATLLWIRTPEARPEPAARAGAQAPAKRRLVREIREGLHWVFADRVLRPLALIAPFCNFSMVSVWTLFLLYAVRVQGLTAAQVGVVFSASSVGGLLGAAVSRRVIDRFRIGRVYAVAMSAIFAGPVLIPLASGSRTAVTAFFVLSFFVGYLGLGVANVVMVSLRQTLTPPALMGRMNAAFRTVLFGGGSLGGLGAGLIADALGLRAGVALLAVASAVMVLPVLLSPVSRLRELPRPAGSAGPPGSAAVAG
ncbi:MFS transporter [Streptacidiphilus jiangxiensis]|uniref:Fucose permease n=1 Tax=Streptacidiphilus jiangxiensis TaxID=235985 RepID=A0A1H7RWY8_STRJI|nr:MFS transporter [Streptacidiphilus jiangxiensis]SEL64732.1 Fucose permease [Streptacidiphilus jiangxiensis]